MLRTLYSRLALTLFVLLCVVGVILVQVLGHYSALYQQEVTQKLNRDLALYIVKEHPALMEDGINRAALDTLFHQLMVINPAIEVYLLDVRGTVVSYNAPPGSVKRMQVALGPIRQYLSGTVRFPLKGDDPRSVDGRKVFTVAEVRGETGLRGYLYVVLGGEVFEHLSGAIGGSYILRSALIVLLAALAVAMTAGLLTFALLTRRLRRLGEVMRRYAGGEADGSRSVRFPVGSDDEIGALGRQFNAMADRISNQLSDMRRLDNARREMVANVSHDLRTPLTSMRGYLETLDLKHADLSEEERRQYLHTALAHSQRLGQMVEDLFELARLDSCESVVFTEPFSMCELVQDVSQAFELRARERSVRLDVRLNPDTPPVFGDISLLQRVIENLLENGLRYTPAGGSIRVAVDVDSGKVVVWVADTGCGISEQDVSRIFERFYQRHKHRSDGTNAGLGLAIVRRILELHGSVIQVTSELEKGTTFRFCLPVRSV